MHDSSGYRLLISSIALTGLVLVLGLAGCDRDEGPGTTPDVGVDQGSKVDIKVDQPPTTPDSTMWPKDKGTPDIKPDVGYTGSAFGCASDSDCFGQKCCSTPWGVKLCAPSCDLKL